MSILTDEVLPDCMMPDGADPCVAYKNIRLERDKLRKTLANDNWEREMSQAIVIEKLRAQLDDAVKTLELVANALPEFHRGIPVDTATIVLDMSSEARACLERIKEQK